MKYVTTVIAIALCAAFAGSALAARNTGGGQPHYSEGECSDLLDAIWDAYAEAVEYGHACSEGSLQSCRFARLYWILYTLGHEEWHAAGCDDYYFTLPDAEPPQLESYPVLKGF